MAEGVIITVVGGLILALLLFCCSKLWVFISSIFQKKNFQHEQFNLENLVREKGADDQMARVDKIKDLLRRNPKVNRYQVARELGITVHTAELYLYKLRKEIATSKK